MKEAIKLDSKAKLLMALVFMVLGFMLSVQFKSTEQQKSIQIARVEDLSERLKTVEAEKKLMARELESLRKNQGNMVLVTELDRMHALAGTMAVEGKGVEIVLDDSKIASKQRDNPNLYIIHDEDLLRVLNELRAAGAEAISINDQRIVAMSEVRCVGPTVSVNNVYSAPPYVIKAIGNPKNLSSALRIRGGVVETFEFWGIQVVIKNSDKIEIPAYQGMRSFEYAKPLVKGER